MYVSKCVHVYLCTGSMGVRDVYQVGYHMAGVGSVRVEGGGEGCNNSTWRIYVLKENDMRL